MKKVWQGRRICWSKCSPFSPPWNYWCNMCVKFYHVQCQNLYLLTFVNVCLNLIHLINSELVFLLWFYPEGSGGGEYICIITVKESQPVSDPVDIWWKLVHLCCFREMNTFGCWGWGTILKAPERSRCQGMIYIQVNGYGMKYWLLAGGWRCQMIWRNHFTKRFCRCALFLNQK